MLVKDIWLENSAPALQALYLFFLVGSFAAPLMEIPFLSRVVPNDAPPLPLACIKLQMFGHLEDGAYIPPGRENIVRWCRELVDQSASQDEIDLPSLKWFYVLVAGVCVVIGIFMIVCGILAERLILQGSHAAEELVPDKQQNRRVTVAVLVLITISGGLFIGTELNYAGFLATFVIIQLNGTNAYAIYITSMFWGIYTLAAAIGVVVSKYLRAAISIFICAVIMTIGLVILAAGAYIPLVTWIGSAIFALGCSSTYGGIFVLADEYVTLTSAVSAVVVCGTTVGEFLVPLISGQVFEMNPMSLMYLSLTCIVVSDIGFVIMEVIVHKCGSRRDYQDLDVEDKQGDEKCKLDEREHEAKPFIRRPSSEVFELEHLGEEKKVDY